VNGTHPGSGGTASRTPRAVRSLPARLQAARRAAGLLLRGANEGNQLVLKTYGRSSGFCVDPIEKKPLAHFYRAPACSRSAPRAATWGALLPELGHLQGDPVGQARRPGTPRRSPRARSSSAASRSPSPTTTRPSSRSTHRRGPGVPRGGHQDGAVSAGYIHAEPRRELYSVNGRRQHRPQGFTEDFYQRITFAHLKPVLETLEYLVKEAKGVDRADTLVIPATTTPKRSSRSSRSGWWRSWGPTCRSTFRLPPRLQDARRAGHAAATLSAPAARRWRRGCATSTRATCTDVEGDTHF